MAFMPYSKSITTVSLNETAYRPIMNGWSHPGLKQKYQHFDTYVPLSVIKWFSQRGIMCSRELCVLRKKHILKNSKINQI